MFKMSVADNWSIMRGIWFKSIIFVMKVVCEEKILLKNCLKDVLRQNVI